MNKKYLVIAFGIVAILLIWKFSSSDSQIAACNSSVVSEILSSNLIEKKKAEGLKSLNRMFTVEQKSPAFEKELSNWSGRIANIREASYDPKTNTRECAADIQHSPVLTLNTQMGAFGLQLDSQPCTAMNYKVQKLLDKPNEVYVSWRCLKTLNNNG